MDRDVPRSVTCIRWRVRINSLSSWWYCACMLALEGYLLYRAVSLCCSYNELPWRPGMDRPVAELYAYIALIVTNVMCLPFFIVFSLFQVGNYANDGVRLGRDSTRAERIRIEMTPNGEEVIVPDRSGVDLLSSWRHVGPLSQGIHVLAAFCLLLPRTLVQAQEIKYGFLPPEAVWWSELDGILGRHGNRRYGDPPTMTTTFNSSSSASIDWTSSSAADHPPIIIGGGAGGAGGGGDTSIPFQLHPEFLNYCIALSFHALRYAAVFWDTAPSLSLLFSIHLILSAGYFALSFCGTSVLYRLLVNPEVLLAKDEDPGAQNFMLTSVILLSLSVVANIIAFLSPLIIFNYGYSHYRRAWKRFLKRGAATTMRFHDYDDDAVRMATCCHGYTQHILATVFLLTMVGLRLPVVFDYVTVYRISGSVVLLASLLADVIVMLGWICLWFLFTVRQRWNFKVILRGHQFVWDATCNGRAAGQTHTLNSSGRAERRSGQKADHRNDRMIDQRPDRTSDQRNDQVIEHRTDNRNDQVIDQRADNRNDHANDIGVEHRSKHKSHHKTEHRTDHGGDKLTSHRGDKRTDHGGDKMTDHRGDKRNDHTGDKRSDRRSDHSSPSIFCGCASSKAHAIQVEENIEEERAVGCQTHLGENFRETLPPTKRRKRPWKETSDVENRHCTVDVTRGNEAGMAQCHVGSRDLSASHPVDLQPENRCVGDGQENFAVATSTEIQSALTAATPENTLVRGTHENTLVRGTPENTLVRGYRWNVRDKCGQYFRQAACYKGQCEKPFRKRPPAPPPSPAPVPHSGCDDSGTGSSPLNEEQNPMDHHRRSPGICSGTASQSELRNPGVIRVMSPLPPDQQGGTDPHRPATTISQSTVQLNSNPSPSAFDRQLLSKSADDLDEDRIIGVTMCREVSGSGSAEVIRIGAKTGALFAPCSAAAGGRCFVQRSSNPRLRSGGQDGRTLIADDRPRSCQYSGSSLSPPAVVYPFLSQSALPHSSLPQPSLQVVSPPHSSLSKPSLPHPSFHLPPPPPLLPPPPQSFLPQPSLHAASQSHQQQQQMEEYSDEGLAELPPPIDNSSSDSTTNSQTLCSQV